MKMEEFWAGLFVLSKPHLFIHSVKEELIEKEGDKKYFESIRSCMTETQYILQLEINPVTTSKNCTTFDLQYLFSSVL